MSNFSRVSIIHFDNLSHLKCNIKLVKLVLTNHHTNPNDCKCFWYILNQLDVSSITTVFQLYQKIFYSIGKWMKLLPFVCQALRQLLALVGNLLAQMSFQAWKILSQQCRMQWRQCRRSDTTSFWCKFDFSLTKSGQLWLIYTPKCNHFWPIKFISDKKDVL